MENTLKELKQFEEMLKHYDEVFWELDKKHQEEWYKENRSEDKLDEISKDLEYVDKQKMMIAEQIHLIRKTIKYKEENPGKEVDVYEVFLKPTDDEEEADIFDIYMAGGK